MNEDIMVSLNLNLYIVLNISRLASRYLGYFNPFISTVGFNLYLPFQIPIGIMWGERNKKKKVEKDAKDELLKILIFISLLIPPVTQVSVL